MTFVYKTGLKNSVDGAKFKPQRKNARGRHRTDELCSHDSNEVDKMCSDSSNDTCGDGSKINKKIREKAELAHLGRSSALFIWKSFHLYLNFSIKEVWFCGIIMF